MTLACVKCEAGDLTAKGHDPGRAGSGIKRYGFAVCVEFGQEVEIVDPGTDRGGHQRLGRVREGTCGVEQSGDALEAVREGIGILDREQPDTRTGGGLTALQARAVFFATRENEVQSGRRGMLRCHATGVAGGSIDHESVHGDSSISSVIIRVSRRCA